MHHLIQGEPGVISFCKEFIEHSNRRITAQTRRKSMTPDFALAEFQRLYGAPDREVFDPRPTPIAVAVRMHLASLVDRYSFSELTPDSALLLSYIQSQRWRKQLEDENPEWAIGIQRTDTPDTRQDASEVPLAVQKRQENLLSRLSLIHNLQSRLQQGKCTVWIETPQTS